MAVTRQDLHEVLRNALDSGEWTVEELHQELNEVYENFQDDEAAEVQAEN
jgi:hypothetical protein